MFGERLRILYFRYKDSVYFLFAIMILVISVCIVLVFRVVIPQVQDWFSITNEVESTRKRLATINNNISLITTLNKQTIDNQVAISTQALPFEKDFGAIVNALSDAAITAGVSLDDYSFQPGNISSVSGRLIAPGKKDINFIKVAIAVGGDAKHVQAFLQEINETLPLSEVVDVSGDTQQTNITLHFYQKQFPPITFRDDEPLVPLSVDDTAFIKKLSDWRPIEFGNITSDTGTSSGIPLF